jgi:hypothetical protein
MPRVTRRAFAGLARVGPPEDKAPARRARPLQKSARISWERARLRRNRPTLRLPRSWFRQALNHSQSDNHFVFRKRGDRAQARE